MATNIVKRLATGAKSLSLDNVGLTVLPASVARLSSLCNLSAKNNSLSDLPEEIANLRNLRSLNLGGNCLSGFPHCLVRLTSLQTLHLFSNKIELLDAAVLRTLTSLQLLNLNNNKLEELTSEVIHLQALRQLSIGNNRLSYLPRELCDLHTLTELYLDNNWLEYLPVEIGALKKLKKLYLQRNRLTCLPQSLGWCSSLEVLDVSCNSIKLFPAEIQLLKLKEFHYEHNPLLPPIPVPADQVAEVLSLKELVARCLVNWMESDTELAMMVAYNAELQYCLQHSGQCAVCGGSYVNSWLDCVQFVSVKKMFHLRHCGGSVPVRVTLCSHACFNTEGHEYYGIGAPPDSS